MNKRPLQIAVYFEHQEWFRPLFAELLRRKVSHLRMDARRHAYDVSFRMNQKAILFNRMSASAYLRGNGHCLYFTRDFLTHLELHGAPVINGAQAFALEISKTAQLSLLRSLGLSCPHSIAFNNLEEVTVSAAEIGFPVIIKPNIGGRGAGILRMNSAAEVARARSLERIQLGFDSTSLVQEFIPARGGHISRVEMLGGKFLYAINVFTSGDNFNLCPAEVCQTEATAGLTDAPKAGLRIEPFVPPPEVIEEVERIVAAGRIDVGGIEYITHERDGRRVYYDINVLSNFIADAPRILGFDPHTRLVDYLIEQGSK